MRDLARQIEQLERHFEQRRRVLSKLDPECICYPGKLRPWVGFPSLTLVAFIVKCPLHGDRFSLNGWIPQFYCQWFRETMYDLVLNPTPSVVGHLPRKMIEQYLKAYFASFPSDLYPGQEEEEDADFGPKTFLRLKDGTRFQVDKAHYCLPSGKAENLGEDSWRERRERDRAGDWTWERETLRIAGRQLAERGLIVDARYLS